MSRPASKAFLAALAKERRYRCREVRECDHAMREACACGLPFSVHGAPHPHTRGDECRGFTPRSATGTAGQEES